MNIILVGSTGHMGQEVVALSKGESDVVGFDGKPIKINIVARVNSKQKFKDVKIKDGKVNGKRVDCIVDFSHHKATAGLCQFAVRNNLPAVIATTGQNETEKQKLYTTSTKIPLFYAANYAMGLALLIRLAQQTATVMKDADIEIVETHHNRKIDAPSGTALAIADAIKEVRLGSKVVEGRAGNKKRSTKDIGISSIRMGNVVGTHEVIVNSGNESISLKHTAYSREIFAEGAIVAASFLLDKKAGLYTMGDMIDAYV